MFSPVFHRLAAVALGSPANLRICPFHRRYEVFPDCVSAFYLYCPTSSTTSLRSGMDQMHPSSKHHHVGSYWLDRLAGLARCVRLWSLWLRVHTQGLPCPQ